MKIIARLSTIVIVSFSSIAPSLAITPSVESFANTSQSISTQPVLVAGFFDQVINTTGNTIRTQRQQQRMQDAELARQQRIQRYKQRRLDRQAAYSARKERERIYFESLTPEQRNNYIAKKKAQQEAQAEILLRIFSSGAAIGDSNSSETCQDIPVAITKDNPSGYAPGCW